MLPQQQAKNGFLDVALHFNEGWIKSNVTSSVQCLQNDSECTKWGGMLDN